MIQIWQVPSECGPSNLVVLVLIDPSIRYIYQNKTKNNLIPDREPIKRKLQIK